MATISSKQKRLIVVNPIAVLASLSLIAALLVLWPFTGSLNDLRVSEPGASGGESVLAGSTVVSFAADEQYWNANCSHGWSGNSSCDDIVARVNSCVVDLNSQYCTQYDAYMEQFILRK